MKQTQKNPAKRLCTITIRLPRRKRFERVWKSNVQESKTRRRDWKYIRKYLGRMPKNFKHFITDLSKNFKNRQAVYQEGTI